MSTKFSIKTVLGFAAVATSFAIAPLQAQADYGNTLKRAAEHLSQARSGEASSVRNSAVGFSQCRQFFVGGHVPSPGATAPAGLRQLCFDAFAVMHSGQSKTPLFVAEKLSSQQLSDAADEERTNKFFADARLPSSEKASLEDYRGSGYDRGHMAPAADMPTAQAMAQSFSLANMVPQDPTNNRKVWSRLESDTRKYVRRAKGDVHVFSGPYFANGGSGAIGASRVWVPTHLFKLVYDASTQKAWAHWLENTETARISAPISYEELTRRIGYELLPRGLVK